MNKILAIDIGNSYTKLGIFNTQGKLEKILKIQTVSLYEIKSLLNGKSFDKIIFSTVVPEARNILKKIFPFAYEIKNEKIPIKINYHSNPGTDRILNCFFIKENFKIQNAIIIDAGSAITIDVLLKGNFHGGIILPGIKMYLQSLYLNTKLLPKLDVSELYSRKKYPKYIGKSTKECIKIGLFEGFIRGNLNHLIKSIKKEVKLKKIKIFITGGDAKIIKKFLNYKTKLIENLTLKAVFLFYKITFY